MADSIAAVATPQNGAADLARALNDLQVRDPKAVAAAIAQSINEMELAALAKLLASEQPMVVRTAQLQEFLAKVLLPDANVAANPSNNQTAQDQLQGQGQGQGQGQAQTPAQIQAQVQTLGTEIVELIETNPALLIANESGQPVSVPGQPNVPGTLMPGNQAAAPGVIVPDVAAQINVVPTEGGAQGNPTNLGQQGDSGTTGDQNVGQLVANEIKQTVTNLTSQTVTDLNVATQGQAPTPAPRTVSFPGQVPVADTPSNQGQAQAANNPTSQSPNVLAQSPSNVAVATPAPAQSSAASAQARTNTLLEPQSGFAATQTPQTPGQAVQMNSLRQAYNSQMAEDILAPKLEQLMQTQAPTVFATALSARPQPVSVTIVDPQRITGDHTDSNAKAFLLGTDNTPFSVVVVDKQIGANYGFVPSLRDVAAEVQKTLNGAIEQAFPEQNPTQVKVVPMNNGTLAIIYQQPHGETLKAAPLMSNAGFSMFAEPVKDGEQLLARISQGIENQLSAHVEGKAKLSADGISGSAIGSNSKAGGIGGAGSGLNENDAAVMSALLNAIPQKTAPAYTPSAVAIGVALLTAVVMASGGSDWKQYVVAGALLSAIALAFSLGSRAQKDSFELSSLSWYLPWKMIRPVKRFVSSFMRGGNEPWVYFAHEQDWLEWSHGARLRAAIHDAESEFVRMFLPSERGAFTVLGLRPTASFADVSAAFRVLAKKYHPDSNPSATPEEHAELTREFQRIMSAYAVLRRRFQVS